MEAGSLYGLWGTLIVGVGVLCGGVIDAAGVRTSLLVSSAATIIARAALATTTSRAVAVAALLGPASLGGALGVPVLTIGVKRASPPHSRATAFSMFYVAMNLAALAAGAARDLFAAARFGGRVGGWGLRAYMGAGVVVAAAEVVLVALFLPGWGAGAREGGDRRPSAPALGDCPPPATASAADDSGRRPSTAASLDGVIMAGAPSPPPVAAWDLRPLRASFASLAALADAEFAKFVAMSLLTVNLKSIFRHLDATLPKFVTRSFGCAAPAGSLYAINPALIAILVPLAGAALSRVPAFDAIHWGGYASALAPLWIVLSPTIPGTALFIATLSAGEAVWSPRWYDYSMEAAPDGREGLFTALASAPLFAAKLPTGALSGWLLETHCAGNGPCPGAAAGNCDGRALWGIIAAVTFTSPVAILLCQRWLRPAPRGSGYARVGSAQSAGGDRG